MRKSVSRASQGVDDNALKQDAWIKMDNDMKIDYSYSFITNNQVIVGNKGDPTEPKVISVLNQAKIAGVSLAIFGLIFSI